MKKNKKFLIYTLVSIIIISSSIIVYLKITKNLNLLNKSGEIFSAQNTNIPQQGNLTICAPVYTTDSNNNSYPETKCDFTKINTGDSFIADIGSGKKVIFTYLGTPSTILYESNSYVEFDTEQDMAWKYKIIGSQSQEKKITMRIGSNNTPDSVTGFSFRDMNYDGYYDLIDGLHLGSGANAWQYIFWFNPSNETFESPDLSSDDTTLSVIYSDSDFDLKNKTMNFSGTSGADGSYVYRYAFLNNKWQLTYRDYSRPDESEKYCIHSTETLVNGKIVEKKTSTPRELDEHC